MVDLVRAQEGIREATITVLVAAAAVVVVVVEGTTSLNPFPPHSQECSVKNVPCIDFMGTFHRMFGRQSTGISVRRRAVSCSAQVSCHRLHCHCAIIPFVHSFIHSFIYLFIYLFIHSFIFSFTSSTDQSYIFISNYGNA